MGTSRVEESEFKREMEQIWVIALSSLLLMMRGEPGQRIWHSQKFNGEALKERKATEKLKTSSQRCKRCEILEVVLYLLPTPVFLPGESQGRGAWLAAVYGVAQSQTRLKQLSSSSSFTFWWWWVWLYWCVADEVGRYNKYDEGIMQVRVIHTKEGMLSLSSRTVVLRLEHASKSPEGCVKMQVAGPSHWVSDSEGLGSSWRISISNKCLIRPMKPNFKNHCRCRNKSWRDKKMATVTWRQVLLSGIWVLWQVS